VTSTAASSILNVSGRAVSLRAQPVSGSRSRRSPPTAGGPQPCGSAIRASWPCSTPYVSASPPSHSPTGPSCPGEPTTTASSDHCCSRPTANADPAAHRTSHHRPARPRLHRPSTPRKRPPETPDSRQRSIPKGQ
jgi:hypothetical protein